MELGIKGRVAIVTGGTRGIGRVTAKLFLEEGVKVAICSRNEAEAIKAAAELASETKGDCFGAVCDTSIADDIDRFVKAVIGRYGTVDILHNNAGTMYSGRFEAMTDEGLQKQLDTKLFGFMRLIRQVHPYMKQKQWGRIINNIGGAGKEPDPYMFGSGITNSALLNITKSLSTEFAQDNILVNAICPGWVDTKLWRMNADGLQKELGVATEDEARKQAARKNALGRFGKPEELANAVVFLCSERASYITGVSLNLDGGRLKGLW
jgi:3-oxoacyl-[acyl-carrier protein] reductase